MAAFKLTSLKFEHEGIIPTKYTCQGSDISPPLSWSNEPQDTKSFVLISDDPDAPDPDNPKMTWVHWVAYDIPPSVHEFSENMPTTNKLPTGGTQGESDFHTIGYGGPCPPKGSHRYFFKLYALDTLLSLPAGKTKEEIVKAMEGHIIDKTELIGYYRKY